MTAFVLMGVSGAGKTTVGKRAAGEMAMPFLEGDDFHPPRNVAKMSAGIPLDDADRAPWIDALATAVNAHEQDVIVACSALSQAVRDRLRRGVQAPVHFLFLTAQASVMEHRLRQRPLHYMQPGMLPSQLAALEPPSDAIRIDADQPIEAVTEEVLRRIRELRGHATPR